MDPLCYTNPELCHDGTTQDGNFQPSNDIETHTSGSDSVLDDDISVSEFKGEVYVEGVGNIFMPEEEPFPNDDPLLKDYTDSEIIILPDGTRVAATPVQKRFYEENGFMRPSIIPEGKTFEQVVDELRFEEMLRQEIQAELQGSGITDTGIVTEEEPPTWYSLNTSVVKLDDYVNLLSSVIFLISVVFLLFSLSKILSRKPE